MTQYLIINLILTCGALLINHLMHIPHKTRFRILMIAVIGWITPFALINLELSQQTISALPVQLLQFSEATVIDSTSTLSKIDYIQFIYAFMIFGMFLFMLDIVLTERHAKQMKQNAKRLKGHTNIYLVKDSTGAFITGYIKPIIWISEKFLGKDTINSVITHEQQHIQQHDQLWLLTITLVQRLFWFNPLAYYLCRQTRRSIELKCDEACKHKLGKATYQSHLAQLVMLKNPLTRTVLTNQFNHTKNFNIYRIKQLNQDNNMTTSRKTKLSVCCLIALLMSTYTLITVANEADIFKIEKHQVLLTLKIQKDDTSPSDISILTKKGDKAGVSFDDHHLDFITHVNDHKPDQIFTEIFISTIENGIKTEIATPSILTTNAQWSGFKFTGAEVNYDIKIMAQTSNIGEQLSEVEISNMNAIPATSTILEPRKKVPTPVLAPPSPPTLTSDQEPIPAIAAPQAPPEPLIGHRNF